MKITCYNATCEPWPFWQMMNAMVRNLELGLVLTIEGDELHGCERTPNFADMIEVDLG
jgi:hypothetical protein